MDKEIKVICPSCKKEAQWVDNKEVYGKRYGKSYMCYWCKDCDYYVGCHNNTKKPLGEMAGKELRQMRMHTHGLIDPLWQSGQYARAQVYARLSRELGWHVHVGGSTMEQCKNIQEAVGKVFNVLHA